MCSIWNYKTDKGDDQYFMHFQQHGMASRDYTDGFISNAASTSKSDGYLPKFEGGSANGLTDYLTGRFEDYSSGFTKITNSY